jgi:hypothetical protein
MKMAENMSRNFNKVVSFAKTIVTWENQWLKDYEIV